jgi:hypothetical protein
MARSRAKQGNRKHRRKVRDEFGNPTGETVGVMHPPMGSLRGERRRKLQAAEMQQRLEEKEAAREIEELRRANS